MDDATHRRELFGDAHDLFDVVRRLGAHPREIAVVESAIVLGRPLVTVGYADVAAIANGVAQTREAVAKPRVADRGRSHVDAAAIAAEVHRDADDLHRSAHAGSFGRGWKIARITPPAASSPPTSVRTFTPADPPAI